MNTDTKLLADITELRDQCAATVRDLPAMVDPKGDARRVFRIVAESLSAIIDRHEGQPNDE